MSSETPSGITQSVVRALRILECFSDENPQLRVSDVTEQLGLTASLVSRLLATLEHEGFVTRDEDTGFYTLGKGILTLAGVALNHNRLRIEALETMQKTSNALQLGVNLSVLEDDAIFYLAHIDAPGNPRPYTLIGRHNPLHATGMGKVLAAFLPEADRRQLLARIPYHAYTAHTLTDQDDLERELADVRTRGWALEMEELALGRACVAGPVRNRNGKVVAAISISGPLSGFRWNERKDELTRAMIEMTDSISMRLGYITAPRKAGGEWRTPEGTAGAQPVAKGDQRP